jgi:signal transduction histidine kinase
MGPWLVELAEGLSQALATPGTPAVVRLFAVTLRPDESAALFVAADGDVRLLGAFPGDGPFREAPVHALARQAMAAGPTRSIAPDAPLLPEWPAALAVGLPDQRGSVVFLGRGPALSGATRERVPWLVGALVGVAEVDRLRQSARRAEARLGRVRQLVDLDARGRELPELGRDILAATADLVDAELGALWLRPARGNRGRLVLAAGSPAGAVPGPAGALSLCEVERLVGPFPLVCPPHPLDAVRDLLGAPDLGSALLAPLERRDALVGLLAVGRRRGAAPFQEAHAEALMGVAELAAIPLGHAALRRELGERDRQLRAHQRIGRAIGAGASLEELFRVTSRELRRLLPFDVAALVVLPEQGDGLVLVGELGRVPRIASWTPDPGHRARRLPARRARRAFAIRDLAATTRPVPAFLREYPEARALLSYPLPASELDAALVLVSRTPGRFGRREARLLRPLTGLLATGIRQSRLARRPALAEGGGPGPPRQLDGGGSQAEIGRLAAALAHEIRNPLTVIGTTIQYLREREVVDEAHRPLLEAADLKVRAMSEAVEGMVMLARPLDLHPEPSALAPLLLEVAEFVQGRAAERSVEVSVEPASEVPPAMVDRRQLGQALLHLAVNAIEAMPDGGQLRLGARPVDGGRYVAVSVTDTSGGMEATELAGVFEPFDTRRRRGSGIQLALTRRIVEAHGGEIEAASEPGRGTTFTLTVPVGPCRA